MNFKKIIPTLESLRKMKPADFIYPSIFVLFLGSILIVFFLTMQFISKNINRAFTSEESAPSQALDIEKYKLVAKKLSISVDTMSNGNEGSPTPPHLETATTTPIVIATSTLPDVLVLDKKSITIFVKNSTSKNGVASTLAKALEQSGFTKPQTGNEPSIYATTTILLAENKSDYKTTLLEEVQKIYPYAVIETASGNNEFDVIVIIGTN